MKPKFLSGVILLLGVVSFLVKAQDKPPGQKPKPLEPSSLQQPEPTASAQVRSAAEKYFSAAERTCADAVGSGCCKDDGSSGFGFWPGGLSWALTKKETTPSRRMTPLRNFGFMVYPSLLLKIGRA